MSVKTSKPSSDAGLQGGRALVPVRQTAVPARSRAVARVAAGLRPIAEFLPAVIASVLDAQKRTAATLSSRPPSPSMAMLQAPQP